MNILLLHQYFLEKDDGGGSRFNEMTRLWSEKGHKITVIAGMVHYATGKKPDRYNGKWTFVDRNFYPGVDVIRCHVSSHYNSSFVGRLWAYFSFVISGLYAGVFKLRGKYDLILMTSPPLFIGVIGYLISRFKRIPFIFEIRDLWPESAIDTGVLKNQTIISLAYKFEKFIYKKSALINVLTPAFREKLISEKNVNPGKIIFIPNAADFTLSERLADSFDIQKFRSEHGFSDKFVITYVGTHGVANHLIQLINAAEKLQDTNVLFLFIGDGMLKQDLINYATKQNLENVRFIDSMPKEMIFKYIYASDMGTSVLKKADTFKTIYSNKTFDYMACKKPVLMLIDGISRKLIEDADCGFYSEPENVNEIVWTVKRILETKEQLSVKGMNGYLYSKMHFDRNVLADQYLAEIEKASCL